jgi:hypothetical protein
MDMINSMNITSMFGNDILRKSDFHTETNPSEKTKTVIELARDIQQSGEFWGSSEIREHIDCTGKRASDILDNLIKGKKYDVECAEKPRRVKVNTIHNKSPNRKICKAKGDTLMIAQAIKENGGFWSRSDIKKHLANTDILKASLNFPCEVAHQLFLRISRHKNIKVNIVENTLQVISINEAR